MKNKLLLIMLTLGLLPATVFAGADDNEIWLNQLQADFIELGLMQ